MQIPAGIPCAMGGSSASALSHGPGELGICQRGCGFELKTAEESLVYCNFLFPPILLTARGGGGTRNFFGHSSISNLPTPFKDESTVQKVSRRFSLSARLTLSETLWNLSKQVSSHFRFKENLRCVKMQLTQRCMGV